MLHADHQFPSLRLRRPRRGGAATWSWYSPPHRHAKLAPDAVEPFRTQRRITAKGFIMKHALILLALTSTFALTACQRETPPPVVQVVAGPAGAPGATGATGAKGAEAQPGATGATGQTGAAGYDGAQGATGTAGNDGAKGEVGAAGYDGAKGDTGAKGKTGDTVIVVPQR
jgi:hypothetical protein